jgi:hypothetical protein
VPDQTHVLPRNELESAVEIHRLSYRLLKWLADAIDRGDIHVTRNHGSASPQDAAYAWIDEHATILPTKLRPEPARRRSLANYFASYITTSFDVVDQPRQILASECGCYCPICARLVNLSRVQPKKVTRHDKRHAEECRIERVRKLAMEEGLAVSDARTAELAVSPIWLRRAAYSAYGQSLLERVRGDEGGTHVLALWREIAWKPEGSPIPGFELRAEDILNAEQELVAELAANA